MTRIAHLLIWASLLTALFIPLGAHAVKKENLYLFSAVKGRIVKNGEPVVGLKVERSTSWNMEEKARSEITYTDEQGYYSFPEMTGSAEFGFLAKLFHVPSVSQNIYVYRDVNRLTIYTNGKGDYEQYSDVLSGEETIRLWSDLNNQKHITDEFYRVESKILKQGEEL